MKCCICGKEIMGYGNNPIPYKSEGRCCDDCNIIYVIPCRLQKLSDYGITKERENGKK